MGQNNSRVRSSGSRILSSPQAPDHPPVQDPIPPSAIHNSPTPPDISRDNHRSHRSTFRRSVLGLISRSSSSPSVSTPKDESSSHRPNLHSLRKRWRSSKRLSKTPSTPHFDGLAEPRREVGGGELDGDHQVDEISASGAASTSNHTPLRLSRPSTPFPISRPPTPHIDQFIEDGDAEVLSERERQLSTNIGTWLSGAPSSSSTSNLNAEQPTNDAAPLPTNDGSIEREIAEFLDSTQDPTDDGIIPDPAIPSDPTPAPPESISQLPSPARNFPPPGTLVVVQGVVNTTDAPPASTSSGASSRPSRLSAPRPPDSSSPSTSSRQGRSASVPRTSHRSSYHGEDRHHTRSGLSSLLPRPTSMINRRPASINAEGSGLNSESRGSDMLSGYLGSDPQADNPTDELRDSSANEPDGGSRSLSPGSIDVLGTLLSVAAAATAASLFSPGFAQPAGINGGSMPINSAVNAPRPLSPTPTAGLGEFGGLNGLSGLNIDPPADRPPSVPFSNDRDGRDRIRNFWESFRERLGLTPRHSHPSSANPPPEGSNDQTETPIEAAPRMRPGELMLAEMARALNAGLGLTNQTERRPPDQSAQDESSESNPDEPGRPLSPEAGFERFLMNLQEDLRTVLTENPSSEEGRETPDSSETEAHADRPLADEESSQSSSSEDSDSYLSAAETAGDDHHHEDVPSLEPSPTSLRPHQPLPHHSHSHTHPRPPTPIPANTLPQNAESNPESDANTIGGPDRRRPAINLWRIYRFQPIPAPAAQSHASSTSTPTPADGTSSSSLPAPTETAGPSPSAVPSDPPNNPSNMPSPETEPNIVVPVIVVGLQSVDTVAGRERANGVDPGLHQDDLHEAAAGLQEPYVGAEDGHPMMHGRPATPRGRTWHSRAANALRTLRPGRRGGAGGDRANEGPGSRTFLIYVIGGYYPPNHHMVTGSDSLDTYEALWELAELLGQVKPPVASKEDIDNSGLQIIKGHDITRHEEDGKVASNCVDRCLVCLDDYAPDDDVRVMSCKHAFHKDCVDKWLQVGRNNCPACRTKGVTTPNDTPASPTIPPPQS